MSRLRLRKVMNLFKLIPELVSGEAGREESSYCTLGLAPLYVVSDM